MFDQDFCTYLEYELSKAFSNSSDQTIKYFWCDGVLLPNSEKDVSKKYVNEKREIVTTAFIGSDGQDRYTLIIKFGNKSLSKYARGLDIKECVPDVTADNWYTIDITKKTLIIHLL
jgi:hypothetical protein